MSPEEARRRIASARVAHLATADASSRPHLVPIVLAVDGDVIYSAVDQKPKRTAALRRLANVAENPAVCVLADHYDDEDWRRLWWARADGQARVVPTSSSESSHAVELLRRRYVPYVERAPSGPVLAIDVQRWSGWAAVEGA